jgi:hypothetical protein
MKDRLILFFDTMWGAPLGLPDRLPRGFELTTERLRLAEADAVVFHIPQWRYGTGNLMPGKPPGQTWVAWSMESAVSYPLLADPDFMRHFDLRMTYRLDSDIPVTYVDPSLEQTLRRPAQAKTETALAAAFISSGWDGSGRLAYLGELFGLMAIDSYGGFMRNRSLECDRGASTKLATLAGYRFTLAFENAITQDYVTEKFFDPLIAGSVPVYLGAPNIAGFAPGDHAYIDARDFPSVTALAAHLRRIAQDEDAYGAYLSWKRRPFRRGFLDLLAQANVHPFTRLCQRLGRHWQELSGSAIAAPDAIGSH